jgi:hypothetical protein
MFRITTAALVAVFLGSLLQANEPGPFDRKVTHVRIDRVTKKEVGRKEGIEAKPLGDPAKDTEMVWDLRTSDLKTLPAAGDLLLDDKGRAWVIQTFKEVPGGKEYLFTCRKLAQPPVPPSE